MARPSSARTFAASRPKPAPLAPHESEFLLEAVDRRRTMPKEVTLREAFEKIVLGIEGSQMYMDEVPIAFDIVLEGCAELRLLVDRLPEDALAIVVSIDHTGG
jgi:hypothetical protein